MAIALIIGELLRSDFVLNGQMGAKRYQYLVWFRKVDLYLMEFNGLQGGGSG